MTENTKEPVTILKTIGENENYTLNVVELKGIDLPCYGIVHKENKVCEMSTSVLANAKKLLTMLNEWELHPEQENDTLPDFSPDMGSFQ